jgi:Domain of unknown function (DUF5666)
MKSRFLMLAACVLIAATAALSHGGEEHVVGTVTKVAQDSITVKTTADKSVTVAVAPETKFIKNKTTAKIAELAVGDRVVIHAKEITEGHLVADTVEFSAAKPPAAPTQNRSGVRPAGQDAAWKNGTSNFNRRSIAV